MIEIKPIYYSDKSHKYYFNNTNAFGSYWATTVYNGEALKGGEIKVDKNGRKYIMGRVEKMFSKEPEMLERYNEMRDNKLLSDDHDIGDDISR